MSEITLHPPTYLLPHWDQIVEGWEAWFDNKEPKDCPYNSGDKREAWLWGCREAMDYAQ